MKIEAMKLMKLPDKTEWNHVDRMVQATEGVHDAKVARVLGAAAAWAYADIDAFCRAMDRAYVRAEEIVSLSTSNSALLVDSVAYLVQSDDKRLAILCFRGTEFKNLTNWITDMSTDVDPFYSKGHVHGGFYRSTLALWTVLRILIEATRNGSICDTAMCESAKFVDCGVNVVQSSRGCPPSNGCQNCRADGNRDRGSQPEDKLQALYICGHSLGGAMAVIAAAMLYQFPELKFFQDKLRGVYTFGQPMIGLKDFTDSANRDFGNKYFRHVYGKDLVPRLPPLSTGNFTHFGTEYVSDKSAETGWIPQTKTVSAVKWASSSLAMGIAAWLQHQLPGISLLRLARMPWSIRDHGPLHYLLTSQATDLSYVFV